MIAFENDAADILARLRSLRDADAPTHGGRVLSYVYDSGLAELDDLAASAIRMVQPVNGLDPTTFTSVAVMEREVLAFARRMLGGESGDARDADDVVGTVTSGGTESCLLAVKTARDNWRAGRTGDERPRLVAPVTAHAAFQKAAAYFGLELDLVPVSPDGAVSADAMIARLGTDVAIVVLSAPSYPYAALDPIPAVAAACAERGISCHVDACIGGFALAWLPGLPPWDFRVPGVTSVSADLHKYGYAPKGASVLLHRGRDRQRAQYFATTRWPGYPVVNSTMLGSKSAGALAASWAIIAALGESGFRALAESCQRSTDALLAFVGELDGLRVVGSPVGPLFAVARDETVPPERQVDPHHWADQVRAHGFLLQQQPGFTQQDGTRLPSTTHLTVTPVTEQVLPELREAMSAAAAEVRGRPPITAADALASLPADLRSAITGTGVAAPAPTSAQAEHVLSSLGLLPGEDSPALPDHLAGLLALVEALPATLAERLLTELLARVIEP